ncbi:hypothetical protein QR680_007022 [Steinernema hermaphroditum]|uniref:Uncharacterized protein n=1 Tax=Steinernema hermaphroditum TaxID=289476 RepID=A0AA39HXF0_9BILA|nr:hypothetical protein QR680_007022 [Steinernema hermaphroditum]
MLLTSSVNPTNTFDANGDDTTIHTLKANTNDNCSLNTTIHTHDTINSWYDDFLFHGPDVLQHDGVEGDHFTLYAPIWVTTGCSFCWDIVGMGCILMENLYEISDTVSFYGSLSRGQVEALVKSLAKLHGFFLYVPKEQ